jgi:glycine/D-amino acid oxidase-like deaminating enzyme
MRLRTFEAFWLLKNGLLHTYPSLKENLQTEIVVVGGGITGALTSHALVEVGYKVVLLDRRDIAQGSTAATTSMLQYEIDVPLYKLAEQIGEESAAACYKAGIKAINELQQLVRDLNIDCGFEKKQSLFIAHNKKSLSWLKKEFLIRDKHALGVQWINSDQLLKDYGLKSAGGILSATAGSIDAYKLAHELIHFNAQRGMQVYDQTDIRKFNLKDKEKASIVLDSGVEISCSKVIFCTGFETTEWLKEKVAKLFHTYASVSEQNIHISEKLKHTLVWNTDKPYSYMRTTDDGRLLIGGEDSSSNNSALQQKIKEKKATRLRKKLELLLPEVEFTDDFNWAGTFGSTSDGLPYIGKSPEFENPLFVLAFGGNGICFSVQAMEIIIDLLEGRENKLAHYYRFGR